MRKLAIDCNGLCRYLLGLLQASCAVEGCIDIDVREGLFHLRLAACRTIYDTHGRLDGCQNRLLQKRLRGMFGRTKVFSTIGYMDFYPVDALLRHVTDAVIIVAILADIKFGSVHKMQTRKTPWDWCTTITEVVKTWIPPTSDYFNLKEKTIAERDLLLQNAVLLLQHSLIYRALGEAVAQGDSERIVKQI